MAGQLIIQSGTGNWTEGIRIKPDTYNDWTTLILGASGNNGTNSNAWSLHTYNGNFYFANNGSDSFSNGLSWTNTGNLNIKSTSSFTYNSNVIWHSGNFNPGNYLSLSGGTMTDSVFLPLNIPALRFGNARAWDSAIAHDTASYEVEAFMTKNIGTKYRFKVGFDPISFTNGSFVNMTNADLEIGAGYCKINNNTVWHAGNMGTGSGLDADLLDGQYAGFSNGKILKLINFPAFSYFGSSFDSYDYYQNIIKWVYNNANDGDTTLAIGVGHPNSLGNLQIQLYGTSGYDSTTNFPRYSSAIYYPLGGPPVIFGTVDYTYYQYTIARTTDNVASATKLQTAHSIWGQSFDGTANVSGALSGVSTISMSGQLTSTLASGTAPFSITSTTLNSNLNADLLDGYHGNYYDQRVYNSDSNFLGGGYNSGGTEKPNWAGFGAGKLKLQMLSGSNIGAPDTWNDVLWMSSYNGGDVKGSNILIFSKYNDRVGFARQSYDSLTWGTYREFYHTGNSNLSSIDWNCNKLYAGDVLSYYDFTQHIAANGIGGWARGLLWKTNDLSTLLGGVYMKGYNLSPNYINIAHGDYDSMNGICILQNGNVGINNTSPGYKLDVNGNAHITDTVDVGGVLQLSNSGLKFADNAFGGGGDIAKMYLATKGGEATTMTFEVENDSDDTINFITPSSTGLTHNNNIILDTGNYSNILNSTYRPMGGN
jgi:hypothetical protein